MTTSSDSFQRLVTLLAKEHELKLHVRPQPHCPGCGDTFIPESPADLERPSTPVPPPFQTEQPPTQPDPPAKPRGNLGPAFARVMAKMKIETDDENGSDAADDTSPFDGGPMCRVCNGARRLRVDLPRSHPEFPKYVDCPKCSKGILLQRRLDRLFGELPDKLREHTLENFDTSTDLRRRALERSKEWLADPGNPWLYISGPVGRGKSHLAVGILKAWIGEGHSGTFKLTRDLLDRIRQGYDDKSYEDVMQSLQDTELLIIDDLGSEHHKGEDDWAAEKLFQIVDGRYNKNGRTIITANFSLDELGKRLGNLRITSRILEMATKRYVIDLSSLPNYRVFIGNLFGRKSDD